MTTIAYKRVFQVDSHRRLSGSTSDFTTSLVLDGMSAGPESENLAIVLMACSIPKSFYNCSTGRNTFTISENNGAAVTVITVPPGNYSAPQFKNQVLALLNALPNGNVYTMTISTVTAKFTMSVTPGTASITLPQSNGNGLHDLFGLNAGSTNTMPFVSTNVVRFSSQTTVQIRTNLVATNDNILQAIYAPEFADFSTIVHNATDLDARAKPLATINSAATRFYVTDETEQPLDLNGLNMTLTVMIYKPLEYVVRDFIRMKMLTELEDSPLESIDATLAALFNMLKTQKKAKEKATLLPQAPTSTATAAAALPTIPEPTAAASD